MILLPLLISSYHIIAILGVFLILLFISLFMIGKHEKGLTYFIWLIVLVCLPIIGPIAYLLKYFVSQNSSDPEMDLK